MAERNLSQFLDNLDEKVLECAICLKRLQQPTTLACLHAFCLSCLQNWSKQKDGLVCPTCSQTYTIPEGGLQKLPPNTFIINLLESIEQLEKGDKVKCLCGNNFANFYCQDCKKYLCSSCQVHHKLIPVLIDHVIHSIEDVQSMTPFELSYLNAPLCSRHKNKLEFYCEVCETPICTNCALTEHKEWEGKHKPIDISEAFKQFQERTFHMKEDVEEFKAIMKAKLENVQLKATKLDTNYEVCRNDTIKFVEGMMNTIKKMEEAILKELDSLYPKKKKIIDSDLDKLSRIACDVKTRWNYISQLLKSNEATALQSSHKAVTSLKEIINVLPDMGSKDDEELHFMKEEESFIIFQRNGIGRIVGKPKCNFMITMDSLAITRRQTFVVKIGEHTKTERNTNKIKATLTRLTHIIVTIRPKVVQQDDGDYVVTGVCPNPGVWKLDVRLGNHPIVGSPLKIDVQNLGLQKSIEMKQNVTDVVMAKGGRLLAACQTNEIIQLRQSGILETKITLPKGVKVNRIHQLENYGNIIFSDNGNKCITVCKPDGRLIKSIGKGVLMDPCGVDVNKGINWIYVVDSLKDCIFVFDQRNSQQIKTIGGRGSAPGMMNKPTDITLTQEGNVIVADTYNHRIQMFDSKGSFIQVLIGYGAEDGKVVHPCGVLIDKDENVIVASEHKLQLYSKKGKLIKRIDTEGDRIKNPYGLCIISQYPRRVAVANWENQNVNIFNY